MAKKISSETLGIFAPTGKAARPTIKAQAANDDLDAGKIAPVSTGLKTGERAALQAIAERHDLTLNALMRYALRQFIVDVRTGKVDLDAAQAEPVPAKKRLKLPS